MYESQYSSNPTLTLNPFTDSIEAIAVFKANKEFLDSLNKAIVDAELKRISRWKTETIFNKLKNKLELLPVEEYNRQQIVEMYINQFIKEKEED